MKIRPYGDRGVLLTQLDDAERGAWLAKLEQALPSACEDYVVGYDSILLVGQGLLSGDIASATPLYTEFGIRAAPVPSTSRQLHTIEVNYNGADLKFVATSCALTIDQVIELHTAPIYTVRMMGFSPGFPYFDGLDARLYLPRRASPRIRIAAGTVAIGGAHAGIYSVASPGGWHLLGQIDRPLFDLKAAQKPNPDPKDVFALAPGDQVRFQPKAVE